MASVEEEIIARLDTVADGLVGSTSYEVLRAVGPFPPRHVSSVALTRALAGGGGDGGAVVWHDIGAPGESPFQPNWRNIGEPWSPARYRLLADSTVRMQGTVMCQDPSIADLSWVPIFTLPPEAAPGANLEFSALTNDNAISRMYVWADGQVVWAGYAIGPHAPVARLPLNFLSWSTTGPA